MAKGHRSQIKRARNESNRETRPSAKLSYARISVQKACYVLDAIRGKDVQTALGILTYNPRYASSVLKKLLESAVANAENNNGMSADNLYVAACYANKGPTMKRIQLQLFICKTDYYYMQNTPEKQVYLLADRSGMLYDSKRLKKYEEVYSYDYKDSFSWK